MDTGWTSLRTSMGFEMRLRPEVPNVALNPTSDRDRD
jgi:hypothetical protein